MHKKFDHKIIEQKWQTRWKEDGIYDVNERDSSKENEYVLVEWPYPSGNLHIGHWYAFAVPDIYVRMRRMQGKQVIFPIGFDAFGLPAENAAIKRNIDPKEWTDANIAHMKTQLASMGNAFTWNKTTSSTDPDYYRWTQWMFTKFFERGIAYRGTGIVNWCPGCNTVIANEQVLSDGTCERSGDVIEKKEMPQWLLRITDYADRLIDDLDALDWPNAIKESQKNWIGRSEGAEIDFTLSNGEKVTVFTTRADTLYGATYLVLAPEHPLVATLPIANRDEVDAYVSSARQKSEIDRTNATKEKTGVKLEGVTATNPASGEEIPVFIADYVLSGYGTGAIMAVPAHDVRDGEFARKFNLPIKQVIARHLDLGIKEGVEILERGDVVDLLIEHPTDGTFLLQREKDERDPDHVHFVGGGTDGESHEVAIRRELLEETGFTDYEVIGGPIDIHTALAYRHTKDKNQRTKSHFYHIKLKNLNQVPSEIDEGRHSIEWVQKNEIQKLVTWTGHADSWHTFLNGPSWVGAGSLVNSDDFDAMDSEEAKIKITEKVGGKITSTYQLRDWSIGRQRYWGVPIPIVYDPEGKAHVVPEEHLPWTLPTDVDFKPTGEAPLAKSKELRELTEKIFGTGWTPEVETMDTFVDSSWYFLRYIDNANASELSSKKSQEEWMPIDIYFGGAEHTTMHLLYSRFWQKVLFDMGLALHNEPYQRRINRSLVLGPDGNKMSKSKGNVIDPDEHVSRMGADTVKMYLAFMGPYGETSNYPWDMGGIAGLRRFLERVYGLQDHLTEREPKEITALINRSVQKITRDANEYKFNTCISALMIFINEAEKHGLSNETYQIFLKLLAPFAPHLAEELWEMLGEKESIHLASWPVADESLLASEEVTISIQVNGKLRGTIACARDAKEDNVRGLAQREKNVAAHLEGKEIVRIVYIPGRTLNFIVKEGT